MVKKDSIIVISLDKKKKPPKAFYIALGILGFIAIYVPFFGSNLRYQTSTILNTIFTPIGDLCMWLGGAMIILAFVMFFVNRHFKIKTLILGILMLWIGAFLTGTTFEIFGYLFGASQPQQGYH